MKKILLSLLFGFSLLKGQTISLLDSYSKESVNFEKVETFPVGSIIDNIMFATKSGIKYKRVVSTSVNVKWFGATGNGQKDDTQSIQKAFNYIKTQRFVGGNITLYFPDGNYKVTATLKMPLRTKLIGQSKSGTIIKSSFRLDAPLLELSENLVSSNPIAPDVVNSDYTEISNITIAGGSFNQHILTPTLSNDYGIYMKNAVKLNLTDVSVNGFGTAGIYLENIYYIKFANVVSTYNKVGLFALGCTSIHSVNSEYRLNGVGVYLKQSYSCNFVTNIIESNMVAYTDLVDYGLEPPFISSVAVLLDGSYGNNFTNSYFEDHLVTFYLCNYSHGNNFTQNFVNAESYWQSDKVLYMDDKFVFIRNSDYNKFSENYFLRSLGDGKQVDSVVDPTGKNNIFDFNLKIDYDKFVLNNSLNWNEFNVQSKIENFPIVTLFNKYSYSWNGTNFINTAP